MVFTKLLNIAKEAGITLDLVSCAGHIAPPPLPPTTSSSALAKKVISSTNTPADKQAIAEESEMEGIIITSVPTVVAEADESTVPADLAPPKRRVRVRPQHM